MAAGARTYSVQSRGLEGGQQAGWSPRIACLYNEAMVCSEAGTAIVGAITCIPTLLTLHTKLGAPIQAALQRWRKTSANCIGLRQAMPFQHSVDVLDLMCIQLWAQLLESTNIVATHVALTSSMSRSSKAA